MNIRMSMLYAVVYNACAFLNCYSVQYCTSAADLGCPFVYDDCANAQSFPYTCSPTGSVRDWCSFDGVYKVCYK